MVSKNAEVKPASRDLYKHPKYRIEIEDSDRIPPGGQYVSCNGKNWLIMPGAEVVVPKMVLEILDNAIEEAPILDPVTKIIRRYVKRKKFPYQNLGPVIDEPRRVA